MKIKFDKGKWLGIPKRYWISLIIKKIEIRIGFFEKFEKIIDIKTDYFGVNTSRQLRILWFAIAWKYIKKNT